MAYDIEKARGGTADGDKDERKENVERAMKWCVEVVLL